MQQWRNSGKMISVGRYEIFYKKLEFSGEKRDNGDIPSIVIVHGFPSSSFDYHKVDLEELRKFGDVILFDHLGFGFSSKPEKDFTFSIFELADYTEMFLKQESTESFYTRLHVVFCIYVSAGNRKRCLDWTRHGRHGCL